MHKAVNRVAIVVTGIFLTWNIRIFSNTNIVHMIAIQNIYIHIKHICIVCLGPKNMNIVQYCENNAAGKLARAKGKYAKQKDVFDDGEHQGRLRSEEEDQEDISTSWIG